MAAILADYAAIAQTDHVVRGTHRIGGRFSSLHDFLYTDAGRTPSTCRASLPDRMGLAGLWGRQRVRGSPLPGAGDIQLAAPQTLGTLCPSAVNVVGCLPWRPSGLVFWGSRRSRPSFIWFRSP